MSFLCQQKKPTQSVGFFFVQSNSNRSDILGPWPLRSTSLGVGHSLSFLELLVAHSFEVGHVEEHVFAGSVIDETETLVRQLLDRAFSHPQSDSQK